jgi:hypothetical protein
MEMILGLVADAANKAEGEKLNALGIFHRIVSKSVPALHPQMALAIEFQATPFDKGKTFQIEVKLLDPDGKQLFNMEARLSIPRENPALRPIIPLAINLQNVVLPHFGSYRFEVSVDGAHKGDIPFEIAEAGQ